VAGPVVGELLVQLIILKRIRDDVGQVAVRQGALPLEMERDLGN